MKHYYWKVIWDTDGEEVDLPSKVKVPVDIKDEEVADWISDKYGWCVLELGRV